METYNYYQDCFPPPLSRHNSALSATPGEPIIPSCNHDLSYEKISSEGIMGIINDCSNFYNRHGYKAKVLLLGNAIIAQLAEDETTKSLAKSILGHLGLINVQVLKKIFFTLDLDIDIWALKYSSTQSL